MTRPDRAAQIKRLAEGVMGWREELGWWATHEDLYRDTNKWDPFSSLQDAFEVATKTGPDLLLWSHDDGYGCRLGKPGCLARDGHGEKPAEAIASAAIAWLDAQEKTK